MARRHDTKQYVEDELIARLIRNLPEVSEMIEKLREIASTRDVDDVGNVDDTKQVHASAFFFCLLSCFLFLFSFFLSFFFFPFESQSPDCKSTNVPQTHTK